MHPVTACYILGHLHLENIIVHVSGVSPHAQYRGGCLHFLSLDHPTDVSSVRVLLPDIFSNFTPHVREPIHGRIGRVEDWIAAVDAIACYIKLQST